MDQGLDKGAKQIMWTLGRTWKGEFRGAKIYFHNYNPPV